MNPAILVIDTATPAVTAGVVDAADRRSVLAQRVTVDARKHAEQITPNVLGALSDAGLGMDDLAAVVVGCGPGPFTGLRVGMATGAAYGHALGIPVYGVCSLDGIGIDCAGETLVVTDARRREVYWARYRDRVRIAGPDVCAPADVDRGAAGRVAGSPEHAALFGLPVTGPQYPTVAGLVAAVSDWDVEPGPLVPLYLRRPDAKPAKPAVTLGALTEDDAARCAELEALLFDADDPWPAEAFSRAVGAPDHHYVGARVAGRVIGYAGVARLGRTPPFEYEVHTIGVDPVYQGRGIGRLLLNDLLDFADGGTVYLEVRTDNAPAIALYRDVGFVEIGVRKRYYRNGADAFMMQRDGAGPAGDGGPA